MRKNSFLCNKKEMVRRALESFSPGVKLFLTLAFFLAIAILVGLGVQLLGLQSDLDGSKLHLANGVLWLKMGQLVQTILLFLVPAAICAFLFSSSPFNFLRLNKLAKGRTFLLVTLLSLSIAPLVGLLSQLNGLVHLPSWAMAMENEGMVLTRAFLKVDTLNGLLFNIFLVGLLPAFAEELFFRGLLQRLFAEWTKNIHAGIWISAAVFSAVHFQFLGFLPRMFLGALFGYLFYFSSSIWVSMTAHFINNSIGVVAYYLFVKGSIKVDPLSSEPVAVGSWMLFVSMAVVALVLYNVYFIERETTKVVK